MSPPTKKGPLVFATAFSKYTIAKTQGNGGSGIVYDVIDEDGKHYALKLLGPEADSKKMKRFQNEISFCQNPPSPNIIKVLDHGVSISQDNRPFYVMPLYPVTLRSLMSKGIHLGDVLPLFGHILNGVEAAHLRGVIHRDLKPENILCDHGASTCVIADFGIARFKEEELFTAVETKNDERLANFQYSAPEQRTRGRHVDHKADIYALGLILNELFTGQIPQGVDFKGVKETSPEYAYLDDLILEMIRQDPARRPDSIEQIKVQLIARGAEFIRLQQLNKLKAEVIPENIVDDPMLQDPPRLIGVDYDNGTLELKLSRAPSVKWIQTFAGLGSYTSIMGKEPSNFYFRENVALIPATEHDSQQLVNHFKNYLQATIRDYATKVEAEHRMQIDRRNRELREAVEREEKAKRIRENILKSINL